MMNKQLAKYAILCQMSEWNWSSWARTLAQISGLLNEQLPLSRLWWHFEYIYYGVDGGESSLPMINAPASGLMRRHTRNKTSSHLSRTTSSLIFFIANQFIHLFCLLPVNTNKNELQIFVYLLFGKFFFYRVNRKSLTHDKAFDSTSLNL